MYLFAQKLRFCVARYREIQAKHKNYYSYVHENKEVAKLVALLANCLHNTRVVRGGSNLLLGLFSYSSSPGIIWEKVVKRKVPTLFHKKMELALLSTT